MTEFSKEIQADSILFRYAKGVSSRRGREFHPYHEIILFLGEQARLYSESGHTDVLPNTLIVIPKETYHQLNILGAPQSYHRCVLHFPDLPALAELIAGSMTSLFVTPVGEEVAFLFQKLIRTLEGDASEATRAVLLQAALPLLLSEIRREGDSFRPRLHPIVEESLSYIGSHLTEALTVDRLARRLNVSASLLSHTFKQEMNISIYQYILKKRLTMAFQRIGAGAPAVTVATECGFSDYSNFYRQYKKAFGISPSAGH
ncbi:MAG: helix-turn-helix transcriptional regulator [Clostridia bacterium]|nr:helix-turn-helix transcriptional regulator [Clostridia bacterium]